MNILKYLSNVGRTFEGIFSQTLKGKLRLLVIVLSEFPLLPGFKNMF